MATTILTGTTGTGRFGALITDAIFKAMADKTAIAILVKTHLEQNWVKTQIIESIKNMGYLRSVENTVVNFTNGSRIHVFETVAARHVPFLPGLRRIYADDPDDTTQRIIRHVGKKNGVDIMVGVSEPRQAAKTKKRNG